MRTRGLVESGPIYGARLVDAKGAYRVGNVEQLVVVGDPARILGEAAGEEVHAVGCAQGQLAALCVDQRRALGRVDIAVRHGHGAAGGRLVGGGVARVQVIPCVVADAVGAGRLVDFQEVDAAVGVRQGDANVVAVDGRRPVGDAVGVDLQPGTPTDDE